MIKSKLLLIPALLAFVLAPQAQAQSYPTKAIRFLVGFPPGGTNDLVARILAQRVGEILGQQVAVVGHNPLQALLGAPIA